MFDPNYRNGYHQRYCSSPQCRRASRVAICAGSIDRKLESLIEEKANAAELVLDGKLLGENVEEVNLAELLQVAYDEFDQTATIAEQELEQQWAALRARLADAWAN